MTLEIVLLAMVALFVGLRLYAVLGQRTGHEQQPVVTRPEAAKPAEPAAARADAGAERRDQGALVYEERAASAIRSIIAADPNIDVAAFLEGAQSAYRMILEAFWRGDVEELRELVDSDVLASFEAAIDARNTAGHRLDNRLVAVERAMIEDARLSGRTAEIEVRFDADIAAVTRGADDQVIAGTLSDAVATHEIWTFRLDLSSRDPNWLLVDTDDA